MVSSDNIQALKLLVAEPDLLDARLAQLDPVPLLLVYTHLSGDENLLQRCRPYIKGAWSFEVDVPHPFLETGPLDLDKVGAKVSYVHASP